MLLKWPVSVAPHFRCSQPYCSHFVWSASITHCLSSVVTTVQVLFASVLFVTDDISGPGRAVGLVSVCLDNNCWTK